MLLSILIFLPAFFALLLVALPMKERAARWFTMIALTAEFLLSLTLFKVFDPNSASLQLAERWPWVARYGISYFVAIDGLSLWLVILTAVLGPIVVLSTWESIAKQAKTFYVCLLLLQSAMLGSFLSIDAVLFYVFWEITLIPMYFIIGIWGGQRRIYATIKFFIYTMAGSLFMLIAIIYMMFLTQDHFGQMSASLLDFYRLQIPFVAGTFLSPQTLLFFAFTVAFVIKVPVFPFHTWLPDAHVEAPTAGSVILAAVMLKMGTYGIVRFSIPMFPEAVQHWAWLFLAIGVFGIVYGALVAMVQPDIKKLVAYSSVSHMGYVVLGLFALNSQSLAGALYQMLNHGVSTGGLFLLVGMIYERTHSREISDYGGLAKATPIYAAVFLVVTLSSIAVPLTNGFVGEFLILLGSFAVHKGLTIIAVTGVIFGAAYMLWMYKRVFFGSAGKLVQGESIPDLSWREKFVIAPIIILIFWMGIFPGHFLNWSRASIEYLAQNYDQYELTVIEGPMDSKVAAAGDAK